MGEARAPTHLFIDRAARAVATLTGWRRYGFAALLGALATAALPPVHAIVLLLPAFTGLVWLIDGSARARVPWRAAFAAGWWFGFGHFLPGIYWIALALLTDPARFGWMVPFAVFGLAAGLALFPGLAAWLTRLSGAAGIGRVLALAVAWTVMELLRGHVLTGFPWNLIGYSWNLSDAMIQLAAATGIYGLSLVTVAAAAMPAVLADGAGAGGPAGQRRRRWWALVAAGAVLGTIWVGGALRLAGAPPVDRDDASATGVRLRIVQANIQQDHKWQADLREANLARHLELTLSPGFGGITHVIWPETAAPFFIANDAVRRRMIAAVVPPGGLVITGAPRTTPQPTDPVQVWNSLHAIDGSGAVVGTYDKVRLVPFGEYVPFRWILRMAKITYGATDFSAGPGVRTLALAGLPPVSPLICYEAIFPGRVVDQDNRPSWLLNITNDAWFNDPWFGLSSGPYQHFASARVRAVEEGLPMVRAANTGISAVVDAYGRVIARLGLGREGVLDAALPPPLDGLTPYARFGDWVLMIPLALAGLLGMVVSRFP